MSILSTRNPACVPAKKMAGKANAGRVCHLETDMTRIFDEEGAFKHAIV